MSVFSLTIPRCYPRLSTQMSCVARKLFATFTAIAVLAVGATCTPAGCLFPTGRLKMAAAPRMGCCGQHREGGDTSHEPSSEQSGGQGKSSCPTCNHPLVLEDVAAQAAVHVDLMLLAPPILTPAAAGVALG